MDPLFSLWHTLWRIYCTWRQLGKSSCRLWHGLTSLAFTRSLHQCLLPPLPLSLTHTIHTFSLSLTHTHTDSFTSCVSFLSLCCFLPVSLLLLFLFAASLCHFAAFSLFLCLFAASLFAAFSLSLCCFSLSLPCLEHLLVNSPWFLPLCRAAMGALLMGCAIYSLRRWK